jgi:C-terminal processing protease CtpA/Prc
MRQLARSNSGIPPHLTAWREELGGLRGEVVAGRASDRLEFSPGPGAPLELTSSPHEGPVAVLVDAACGSSCENAVHLFRKVGATIVGENTAGAIHFGQAGRLVLPNSKTVIVVATQYVRYDDGSFLEKVGFSPDVPVAPETDAMDVALEWVTQALQPR